MFPATCDSAATFAKEQIVCFTKMTDCNRINSVHAVGLICTKERIKIVTSGKSDILLISSSRIVTFNLCNSRIALRNRLEVLPAAKVTSNFKLVSNSDQSLQLSSPRLFYWGYGDYTYSYDYLLASFSPRKSVFVAPPVQTFRFLFVTLLLLYQV